ncbi:2Fe-2S iron-sulfur cluster-binding protein [Sphingobium baderi]|uniref:2Fe-2S iron-sulfur cluster-binding protein n=1 Tax=Sphingobium baderi TaxID=1332080 RepID=UPI0013157522|nr:MULTISPECIES: 2Fe-2S iron-sulfur cluster-binding protein [Sphingobium]WRD76814.1 2Fe-2S iron-sulfur cluster-binding protein [Sphingobium baderi]
MPIEEREEEGSCAAIVVRVEPAGVDIPVPAGKALMASAQSVGIRWPNVCGGQAQCGVCAVEVLESDMPLPVPSLREQQMLDRLSVKPRHGGTMRLACQLVVPASARVSKPGVRKPAVS